MSCGEAESYKLKGNDFIKQKDYEKAVENYTKAIELCPDNYTYYSNRSAAYASMGNYEESLEDAQKTIDLNPSWGKGYSRLGAALEYLGRIEEAKDAYQKGLTKDPTNVQLKDSLEALNSSKDRGQASYGNVFEQLMKDPKMQQLFRDPKFMQKVGQMGNSPDALLKDPEFLNMFSNIMSQGGGSTAPSDHSSGFTSSGHRDESKGQEHASRFTEDFREPADTGYQKPETEACHGDCRETCHKQKGSNTVSEADKEKELGNCAYKKRDFDCALQHYEKAKTLNPNTIVYDLNISAVLFEQGKYDECIKVCQTAIEEGRSRVEPFALIAKAYARIGNVYNKLEDYTQALEYYEKSLSESRDSEVVKKAQSLKKMIGDMEAKKYINPELAEVERQRGNDEFAAGRFDESIKHYTESIKRNPNDAKTYSNRAAAYTKLMEYSLCIQDCNQAIELDPKFVKSYLRKANALMMLRDPQQAKVMFEKALEIEPHNQEARSGYIKAAEAVEKLNPEEVAKSALRDPEVQEIFNDPSMRLVLESMQNDPASCANYLRDPVISRKIEKLVSAGIIKLGTK